MLYDNAHLLQIDREEEFHHYHLICPQCHQPNCKIDDIEPTYNEKLRAVIVNILGDCGHRWQLILYEMYGGSVGILNTSEIDYQYYINTPEWKQKATEAKEYAGWHCQLCNREGDKTTLHAHHRTYERLGNELPEDITVLCNKCHAKFHDK